MPNVKFVREDLKVVLPKYRIIDDCIEGEIRVKERRTEYLPQPNSEDDSIDNSKRYIAYLKRAVFYNATKRTLKGIVGLVYLYNPEIKVPASMESIVSDIDGTNVDLIQGSKKAVEHVLAFGRAGLFVDYPTTGGNVSLADQESRNIRPTVTLYKPFDIINWRTVKRGSNKILSLVVLKEKYIIEDDGFEFKEATQYRVLRLDDVGLYVVEIWRELEGEMKAVENFNPTDSSGKRLDKIPFMFIGVENNDETVDKPPLYDLASLNIAHYRNSADYEEACFLVGQPTPYFTGLTEDWVTNVLKGKVSLGARGAVPLPINATAGLLQTDENTMPKEGMEHKERQMMAIGAKLFQPAEVERTATEANIENTSENSTLTSSARNVSAGYKWALEQCAMFMGIAGEEIVFELNTDFDISGMTFQERQQLLLEWQSGAIAFPEMRVNLKKARIATMNDEEAKKLIEKEMSLNLDNESSSVVDNAQQ